MVMPPVAAVRYGYPVTLPPCEASALRAFPFTNERETCVMWKKYVTTAARWGFTRNEAVVLLFLSGALVTGSAIRVFEGIEPSGDTDFTTLYRQYDSAFAARASTVDDAEADRASATTNGPSDAANGPSDARPAGAGTATASAPVDINRDGEARLQSLPGIGPATAKAIVAWRAEHGRFRRIEDVMDVPRIGPKKFERLRGLIIVGRE
jgi:competence ComEA-like helix-hairpin-helix protein